jgi:hypothetical protein
MHKRSLLFAALGAFVGIGTQSAVAAEHFAKRISVLEVSTAGCYFFQLEGVTQADPAIPNNVWFGIPTGQANAKEMYALLMAVRLNDGALSRVLTTGGAACGAAQIQTIDF